MIARLADHNIEGHTRLLFGTLAALGWVELLVVRLATFSEVGLSLASSDRDVWRRAQESGMLLLTDIRSRSGADSLDQTLLEEYTATSLPVLTVGRAQRLLADRAYRHVCAERIATIILDLDSFRGVPRLYIP